MTLRAREPAAEPLTLHPRVTLVVGATESDKEALRSTFAAITSPSLPALEALIDLGDTTVPLDVAFSSTYGLERAPSAVLEVPRIDGHPTRVPSKAPSTLGTPEFTNSARIAALRAEKRAVRSELTLVGRALAEERADPRDRGASTKRGRQSRVDELFGASTRTGTSHLQPSPRSVGNLSDRLELLLERQPRDEALELADRLEQLDRRREESPDRDRALVQLMAECRSAIESTNRALEGAHPGASEGSGGFGEIERIREEMLRIASQNRMSRRQRHQLNELRRRGQAILGELGYASYGELLASRGSDDREIGPGEGQTAARLELLMELQDFWRERLEQIQSEDDEVTDLLERSTRMLGESGLGRPSSLRMVARRLRRFAERNPDRPEEIDRLAGSLADTLGIDSSAGLDPHELLEAARAETSTEQSGTAASPTADRIHELEELEMDLARRLELVGERLDALERASEVPLEQPVPDSGGNLDPRVGDTSVTPGSWALPRELDARRGLEHVGSLPVLLLEHSAGSAIADMDPLSVVALGASNQIVWVSDRGDVLSAIEAAGAEFATVIAV